MTWDDVLGPGQGPAPAPILQISRRKRIHGIAFLALPRHRQRPRRRLPPARCRPLTRLLSLVPYSWTR